MAGPKVVVIGAGSYFFGRPAIWNMACSPILQGGTLALVDTNAGTLRTMMALAKKAFDHQGAKTRLEGATDRRDVLKDADFVVLSFSERNTYFRGLDCELAAKHGIRMCSGDTIGPGGVFRALREVPHALAMANDVAELSPNAWVINFVNPTTVLGMALRRFAPNVKSFALCDGHHEPYNTRMWCKRVGITDSDVAPLSPTMLNRLELKIGGVNHNTWMVKFTYDGVDMLPKVRQWLAAEAAAEAQNPGEKAKPRLNQNYALRLFDLYGAYPTAISHTKEYVHFFQRDGIVPTQPEPIRIFDAENRQVEMDASWAINEELVCGQRPMDEFFAQPHGDHATDIIESMWGGLGKSFYINTFNNGAITNMADDAFVELRCDVDMRGPRPQPLGPMPRGVRALQEQTLDTHELTALAAVTCDREILLRAMMTDPLATTIDDGRACMEEMLERQRDILPAAWYR
jgi:alpha-galactosidase